MATLESLEAELKNNTRIVSNLCESVEITNKAIATINERCLNRGQTLDGHTRTLYGDNGAGGIVARVNTLNGDCINKKAANVQVKDFFLGVAQKLIVWGIISVVVFLLYSWKAQPAQTTQHQAPEVANGKP